MAILDEELLHPDVQGEHSFQNSTGMALMQHTDPLASGKATRTTEGWCGMRLPVRAQVERRVGLGRQLRAYSYKSRHPRQHRTSLPSHLHPMPADTPLTVSALRECISRFNDEDPIEMIWLHDEGQKLFKQVSLLVRREESRKGQAGLSPRTRALKTIKSAGRIEAPSDREMALWSQNHASFWSLSLNFEGRHEINMVFETLDTRLRMTAHLDVLDRSFRTRKRFLCLFLYDFAKTVHPHAERLGAATIRSVVAHLRMCGLVDVDTDQLKTFLAIGRRLDELSRVAGTSAIFCLPQAADEGNR